MCRIGPKKREPVACHMLPLLRSFLLVIPRSLLYGVCARLILSGQAAFLLTLQMQRSGRAGIGAKAAPNTCCRIHDHAGVGLLKNMIPASPDAQAAMDTAVIAAGDHMI